MKYDDKTLHEEFGLPARSEWFTEDEAPESPNRSLIERHLDGALEPETDSLVSEMLIRYRDWHQLASDIVQARACVDKTGRLAAKLDGRIESSRHRQTFRRTIAMVACLAAAIALVALLWNGASRNATITDRVRRVVLGEDGSVQRCEGYSDAECEGIKRLSVTGRFAKSEIVQILTQELRDNPTMSAGSTYSGIVAPFNTAIRSFPVEFKWKHVAEAREYVLQVFADDATPTHGPIDVEDGLIHVTTQSPELTVNAGRLQVGQVYKWRVLIRTGDTWKLTPQGSVALPRFVVLTKEQRSDLRAAETQARESHLLSSILYVDFGLLDEAERELDDLVIDNPEATLLPDLKQAIGKRRIGVE